MNENPPTLKSPPGPSSAPAPAQPPAAPAAPAPVGGAPATPAKPNGQSPAWLASPWFVWPAAVVLAAVLFLGIDYLVMFMTHESTDDAFITGHIVSVAPRVGGQVVAVHVLDNQMVHSNDLLVEIDPADYSIVVSQKRAAAASEEGDLQTVLAAYELMRAKVATAEATARKADADADAAQATAENAHTNFNRAQDLIQQQTISRQEYDADQAADIRAQADLKSAQENVGEEVSLVNEANKQLDAVVAQKGTVLAQLGESLTNIAAAELNLSYTKIYAATDGRVTRKAVEVGDYLQAGQQILSLVPPEVWVVANFKESQLDKMQPNQPVTIAIDALGGREFRGHVDSVQAGSGAQFSLLPPENATGNFVKVIQRVPVKILFDEPLPADHTIGPGLSVTPSVQVSTFTLPAWLMAVAAAIIALVAALVFQSIMGRKTAH
jgi:membrane fusion protein (multidrug efflux system)